MKKTLVLFAVVFIALLSPVSTFADDSPIETPVMTPTPEETQDPGPAPVPKPTPEPPKDFTPIVQNETYTYEVMQQDLNKLSERYPELVKVVRIGKSEYGRHIYAVSVGKGPAVAFVNGAVHAREWIAATLNMTMIEKYAEAYTKGETIDGYNAKKILDQTTLWFVPMANPDGVTLQQKGLAAFPAKDHKTLLKLNGGSKNFKRWKSNAKGIDLNRNFDGDWKYIQLNPGKPWYQFYSGKTPLQAKEARALYDFTLKMKPEMVLSYHSAGEVIYWWFLQQGERKQRDYAYAKQLGKLTGYRLMPAKNDSTAGGTYTDWVRNRLKKPAITIELCKTVNGQNPPISEFPVQWKKNRAAGLYIAAEAFKLYQAREAK